MTRTWDEVDERVLRWVFGLPPTLDDAELLTLALSSPVPFPSLAGLDTRQVNDALYRLASADLIVAGHDHYGREASWWDLRLAPLGLKVLGEWPDLERVASAVGIRELLLHLADDADPEARGFRRRPGALMACPAGPLPKPRRDTAVHTATPENQHGLEQGAQMTSLGAAAAAGGTVSAAENW